MKIRAVLTSPSLVVASAIVLLPLLNSCANDDSRSSGATSAVSAPSISPNGGRFTSAQNVTLNSSQSGVSIYYTVNGASPSTTSTLYTASFSVSTTQTVKAIAVKNSAISEVASASFTILLSCGNGVINADEQCDDGNSIDNDGCSNLCLNP